jgi:phosphatidylserine decarboxylase
MKKLFLLQLMGCIAAFFAGQYFQLRFWQIALGFWLPVFVAGYAWLWWFQNIYFFRNPERIIPEGDDLILSPADGRIMYLYPVRGGEVVCDKQGRRIAIPELAKTDIASASGWLLGIYMTPFDVHFNRAPMDGKIRMLHYYRTGANLPMVDLWEYVNFTLFRKAVNLFASPFHLENERMTFEIQNARTSCVVILIADRFVNKISRFFEDGQSVGKGSRIAFIQRGSQTDLFIPQEHVVFKVHPGDQVYAGSTVLGAFTRQPSRAQTATVLQGTQTGQTS